MIGLMYRCKKILRQVSYQIEENTTFNVKKKNPSIRLEKKPIRPVIEKIAKKTGDHKATIEIDIADHFSNGVRDRDRNFW